MERIEFIDQWVIVNNQEVIVCELNGKTYTYPLNSEPRSSESEYVNHVNKEANRKN